MIASLARVATKAKHQILSIWLKRPTGLRTDFIQFQLEGYRKIPGEGMARGPAFGSKIDGPEFNPDVRKNLRRHGYVVFARLMLRIPLGTWSFHMLRWTNLGASVVAFAISISLAAVLFFPGASLSAGPDDDAAIAKSLAEMLRAARQVISNNQARINDPNVGDKGLSGLVVLQQAVDIYKRTTGTDPTSVDPASRLGKLLRAQMDAIVEATDANQTTINAKGVGFKAFIPAVFARLVNEAFENRAKDEAQIKVTAPEQLVRNRKSRPDQWEADVIRGKLLQADWPRGQAYSAITDSKGRSAYRMMMPEYYASSCLSCHGSPKGETDITGYPKEGGKEGDLGAIISVTLFK
jgi:hypothetical protein